MIRCRILQCDGNAAPMGRADPRTVTPRICPDKTERDVVIDAFTSAAAWLVGHLRVVTP